MDHLNAPTATANLSASISTSLRLADGSDPRAGTSAVTAAISLIASGFNYESEYTEGRLSQGAKKVISAVLRAGTEYVLVANGCDDALGVEVELYDEHWRLVDRDETGDSMAVVRNTPAWTGAFHIVVKMEAARRGGAAYFNLVKGYR